MKCEKCGFEFSDGALACPQCGAEIAPETEKNDLVEEALNTEKPAPKKKKKPIWIIIVAIVLAVVILGSSCLCCVGVLGGGALLSFITPGKGATGEFVTNSGEMDEAEEEKTTPDCVGLTEEEARDLLEDAGFSQINCIYEYSDDVAEGRVIRQDHPAGSGIPFTNSIDIIVSLGNGANPEGYDQLVRVLAFEDSYYASLIFYEWNKTEWEERFVCEAIVGKQGVDTDYGEGKKVTPEGTFPLGFILSETGYYNSKSLANELVDDYTCIVDDEDSVFYNTLQDYRDLPRGTSYEPVGKTICSGDTNAMIFIEHNGDGYSSEGVLAGKGSAITICGVDSLPNGTAGCIDVMEWDMDTLISLLDYEKNPHIEIVTY